MADYDLAIIGGGINGIGLARDAAGRGLRVLLVEQNDLASGTSSASTKLIHGGLRYLEHGAIRLVHEALTERELAALPEDTDAAVVVAVLRRGESVTFRELIAGVEAKGVVIARFLAVLELYRHSALAFEQLEPLGELTVRWTSEHWSDENLANLGADYDS